MTEQGVSHSVYDGYLPRYLMQVLTTVGTQGWGLMRSEGSAVSSKRSQLE